MGYKIFLFIFNLIIICIVMFSGKLIKNHSPKINYVFGYRTKMSMKTNETWQFANNYAGNLMINCSKILLIILFISQIFILNQKDYKIASFYSLGISFITISSFFYTIIKTEIKLRKLFDKNGNKKIQT